MVSAVEKRLMAKIEKEIKRLEDEIKTCYGERCSILEEKLETTKKELESVKSAFDINEIKKCIGDECKLIQEEIRNTKRMMLGTDTNKKREVIPNTFHKQWLEKRRKEKEQRSDVNQRQSPVDMENSEVVKEVGKENEMGGISEVPDNEIPKCPTCEYPVSEGTTVCPECGEKLMWIE